MSDAVKARRGDITVRLAQVTNYNLRTGTHSSVQVTIGRVSSITRDGAVKTILEPFTGGDDGMGSWSRARDPHNSKVYLIPAGEVDGAGVLARYSERRYPTAPHSAMIPPLESLDEARELISPFRR